MESLVNYDSEDDVNDENGVCHMGPSMKKDLNTEESDTNYDNVGMDESDDSEDVDGNTIEDSYIPEEDEGNPLANAPLHFRTLSKRDDSWSAALESRNSIDMEMDDEDSLNDDDSSSRIEISEESPEDFSTTIVNHIVSTTNTSYLVDRGANEETVSESKFVDKEEDFHKDDHLEETNSAEVERKIIENESDKFEDEHEESKSSQARHKRCHSPDTNIIDYSRRRSVSKSPERSWKNRRLSRRSSDSWTKSNFSRDEDHSQRIGQEDKSRFRVREVEQRTGITLPTYYNPGVMNPIKYAQQIQKRKLLWGNKGKETNPKETQQPAGVAKWEGTTFKGDNDGKMTEKFKRLMGIKTETAAVTADVNGDRPNILEKQEQMFSNMEAQYQVARMVTHTHRGVGLGYGTYQKSPLQKHS